jgi:hypothetical protein
MSPYTNTSKRNSVVPALNFHNKSVKQTNVNELTSKTFNNDLQSFRSGSGPKDEKVKPETTRIKVIDDVK